MDHAALETPVGTVELGVSDGALVALRFVERSGAPPHEPSGIAERVRGYFEGDLDAIADVPVRFELGTRFQREVWTALRGIPHGQTISYAELARRVGRPGASRAVGGANGRNPVGVVVPCHRVIAADGTLGGYGGGLDRKRWLLAHEGVALVA